jgi:hypothetical protein
MSSSARVRPQDRTATYAYLEAELAYAESQAAATAASTTALEALAHNLDGECPGVLTGAKLKEPALSELPRSRKQDAEEDRNRRQLRALSDELDRAVELVRDAPYQQAALAFAHKVRALRWANGALSAYEHASAATVEWEVQGAQPPVCADMKAWVASGNRTLAVGTKALDREREALVSPLLRLTKRLPGGQFAPYFNPLSGYEGPREKALARRITEFRKRDESQLEAIYHLRLNLELALGVIGEAEFHKLEALKPDVTPKVEPEHTKHPAPQPIVRTIAQGTVPGGPAFWITGTRSGAPPQSELWLEAELANELEAGGTEAHEGEIGTGLGQRHRTVDPFSWQIRTGCQPHEFAIFSGILTDDRDTVLVRGSGRLIPLRRARIPASLKAHGILAYIVLPTAPSELVLRTPGGKAVFAEKLAGVAREVKAICEGEAEGPG